MEKCTPQSESQAKATECFGLQMQLLGNMHVHNISAFFSSCFKWSLSTNGQGIGQLFYLPFMSLNSLKFF